jgi:F-box-like
MSVSSIGKSNILVEDVLQTIFQQLEGEDLLNCEAVCRQWQNSLLSGTPWRRLFNRQVARSPAWQRVQKILEKNQRILRTEEYRDICKNILQAKRNWRTGNFAKFIHSLDSMQTFPFRITMNGDCVVWNALCPSVNGEYRKEHSFLDTESMEITDIPEFADLITISEILFSAHRISRKLEVIDSNKRVYSLYDGREDDSRLYNFVFESKLLAVSSYNMNSHSGRIQIWKLESPPILLNDRTFSQLWDQLDIFKVDERFIVAKPNLRTLYLTSTETLKVLTSLSVRQCKYGYDEYHQFEYNRGLLFQSRGNGIIRILDVATGTHFNDVRLPLWNKENKLIKFVPFEVYRQENEPSAKLLDSWASSNSNFLVIGWKYWNTRTNLFYLSVYDLNSIKKNSDPDSHLLYTLNIQLDIDCFLTNESQIVCYGRDYRNERKLIEINFVTIGLGPVSSALQENREVEDVSIIKIDRSMYI